MKSEPGSKSAQGQLSLGLAGIAAARWATTAAVLRFLLAFAVQVYFARLLGPDVYGVFATAALTVTLGSRFVDLGLPFALLRVHQFSAGATRVALTWQCLFGIVVATGVAVFSIDIASAMGDARAAPLVAGFSIAIALAGPVASAQTLLTRTLRNRAAAGVQLSSYFVGFCLVAILMSHAGYGVWSLVVGTITTSVLQAVTSIWLIKPTSLKPRFHHPDAKGVFQAGALAMATSLVNTLVANLDRIVIAKAIGSAALGTYATAANVANVPTNTIVGALSPIFLTLGSRVADDPARIGAAYLRLLTIIAVLIQPVYAVGAVTAPAIVRALFGEQWTDSGPVLRALFLAVPWFIAYGASTPVLWNTDRRQVEVVFQGLTLLATAAALLGVAVYGVLVVAWVAAAMVCLRGVAVVVFAASATGVPISKVMGRFASGGTVALVSAGAAWLSTYVMDGPGVIFQVALPFVVGACATLTMLVAIPVLVDRATWLLIVPMLPAPLRSIVVGRIVPRAKED